MICGYLFMDYNIAKSQFILIVGCFLIVIVLCYSPQILDRMKPISLTILIVGLFTRYCNNFNVCYQMDMFTVHLFVWQFIYLMCKWEDLELMWPCLILQQASCCISSSITTFFLHDIVFLDFPFQWKITFLWLCSLCDM